MSDDEKVTDLMQVLKDSLRREEARERARKQLPKAEFIAYFVTNYPAGSVISNPEWHAERLYRYAARCFESVAEVPLPEPRDPAVPVRSDHE